MSDDLPTNLRISVQIRIAAKQGIPMMVVHKGDPNSGAIYLKSNRLDGTAEVFSQIRTNEGLAWLSATEGKGMPEREADDYLAQQLDFDPDMWIIEIEDRQGRHWFPEKILTPHI
ncbi:MAG: DUF1491 family protein [Alphaproteobacteria bacterium]|nr:DUF1491 family protein [Alphaproteobacteria bacterium]